jgi:hypothetical protein
MRRRPTCRTSLRKVNPVAEEKKAPTKGKGWVWVTYPSDAHIVTHALHPGAAKARIADIRARYFREPDATKHVATVHVDYGGPIRISAPRTLIALSRGRQLSVHTEQLEWLKDTVEEQMDNRPLEMGGKAWMRLRSWPGLLVYMSPADVKKVLAEGVTADSETVRRQG